ncbi:MAG: T9SS type A sorting domain-containing protein [Crocinitomicaceae bacterium]
MKKLLIALLSIFCLGTLSIQAQCVIDYTQTQPGIYPDTLPNGMVGVPYSEGITFVMPLDTSGFDFTNFYIQSISGLPFGLNWQCNSPGTNCNYDPQADQYGCMEVYGTPLMAGTYPLDVTVIATLNVLGDVPAHFYTQVIIEQDTSSNNGFTTSGSYGCAPMTVSFTNNNPGLLAYNWDFGNGATSSQENPSPQDYNTPGEYVVTYEAFSDTTPEFYLTEVQVLGIPNSWGWPGDLNPDIYINVTNSSGTVFTSAVIDDTQPPVTFGIPNLLLTDEVYTVEVWDEDGGLFGGDDDLGSSTFDGHGTSGNSTSGSTSIAYTIAQVGPFPSVSSTDTIQVFALPNAPNIDSLGLQLWTDSLNLSLQWYQNGNPIAGATNDSLLATTSGDYFVLSSTPEGCFASSDTISLVICDTSFTPPITQNGHLIYTDTSSYAIQWYHDGNPIPGETSQLLVNDDEGDFWVQLTSYDGCIYTSDVVTADFTAINEFDLTQVDFSLYPNPTSGEFTLQLNGVEGERLSVKVLDLAGRSIYFDELVVTSELVEEKIFLNGSPGVYIVNVDNGKQSIQKKLILK